MASCLAWCGWAGQWPLKDMASLRRIWPWYLGNRYSWSDFYVGYVQTASTAKKLWLSSIDHVFSYVFSMYLICIHGSHRAGKPWQCILTSIASDGSSPQTSAPPAQPMSYWGCRGLQKGHDEWLISCGSYSYMTNLSYDIGVVISSYHRTNAIWLVIWWFVHHVTNTII